MASDDIQKLLQQAASLARSGDRAQARKLLEQALALDDSSERAWLMLARVVDTPRERRICYENVLDINPNNDEARRALEALRPSPPSSPNVQTPSTRMASGSTNTPRAPQQPVKAPTVRAGTTTPGTADAWRSQRSSRGISPVFLVLAGVAVLFIIIGLLLVTNTISFTPEATPTAVAQRTGTVASATPAGTPTETEIPGIIVPISTSPFQEPTWTPTATSTPRPSPTPLPTLPPLTSYELAYIGEGRGRDVPSLYIARGDGSGEKLLVNIDTPALFPAWSPDGTQIAFTSLFQGVNNLEPVEQIFVANADGTGAERPLLEMAGSTVRHVAWAPDGTQIAFSSNDMGTDDIFLFKIGDVTTPRLTDARFSELNPAWSPDGTKIVYAADLTGRGALQIYVRDLTKDGTAATTQLTNSQGQNYSPSWSPDGRQIVFISTRNRFPDVFMMRADGTDERVLTFDDGDAEDRDPVFSPDGRYILFSSTRGGNGVYNLWVMLPDGRNVTQVTTSDANTYGGTFRPKR